MADFYVMKIFVPVSTTSKVLEIYANVVWKSDLHACKMPVNIENGSQFFRAYFSHNITNRGMEFLGLNFIFVSFDSEILILMLKIAVIQLTCMGHFGSRQFVTQSHEVCDLKIFT